jgi:hypothetical protein
MAHFAEAKHMKSQYSQQIMELPNVVGVGIGYKLSSGKKLDELCIAVLVRKKLPIEALPSSGIIPHELEGVKTDVIEVGELRAQQARTDRWRPIPGGVSIGHYLITAGTLSCVVRDRSSNERLILSNNHVLANSNQARLGDSILQPGAADQGNVASDTVAQLIRFVPISFTIEPPTCGIAEGVVTASNKLAQILGSGHRLQAFKQDLQATNQVDAAVARPEVGIEFLDEILEIGVVGGVTPAKLGMRVRKSGRSTGFTTGQITILDASVDVNYGEKVARFEGQIITTGMSAPGDSGSLLVAEDALLAVGLLFAGSEQVTIYNPIQEVLDELQVLL